MTRLVAGVVVTVALLAWTLHGVSWSAVGHAVAGAHPGWLLLGVLTLAPVFALRARRWGTLLSASGDPGPFAARHAAVWIGYAGNCLLPASAGEIARVGALRATAGVAPGAAFGAIVAERMLDAVVVFLLLLWPWTAVASDAGLTAFHVTLLGGTLLAGAVGLFIAAHRAPAFARLAGRIAAAVGLAKAAPRVERLVGSLLGGLAALRRPRLFARAFAETVLLWVCNAGLYWAVLLALGLDGPGLPGAVLVLSLTAFSMALPSTPGFFGPYEAAVRVALAPFAIAHGSVVACALTLHLLIFGTCIVVGLSFAARLGTPLFRRASPDTDIR